MAEEESLFNISAREYLFKGFAINYMKGTFLLKSVYKKGDLESFEIKTQPALRWIGMLCKNRRLCFVYRKRV